MISRREFLHRVSLLATIPLIPGLTNAEFLKAPIKPDSRVMYVMGLTEAEIVNDWVRKNVDGKSWATAFPTIGDAMENAEFGDRIYIEPSHNETVPLRIPFDHDKTNCDIQISNCNLSRDMGAITVNGPMYIHGIDFTDPEVYASIPKALEDK